MQYNPITEILLHKWNQVLTAMGTPTTFSDTTAIQLVQPPALLEEHALRVMIAPGFMQRRQFMEQERKAGAERKELGMPERWPREGDACFMCDAVGQALHTEGTLLLPAATFQNHILIPNKYPSIRGHALLVAKQDNTLDPTITREYLEAMVRLAHAYDVVSVRNHPQAGMSIPDHEHAHVLPRLVPTTTGTRHPIYALTDSLLEPESFGISTVARTRFDTRACVGKGRVETAYNILSRLARNEIIFTFYYDPAANQGKQGAFFITPHKKADAKVSGSYPLYNYQTTSLEGFSYEAHLTNLESYIYTKGTFPWNAYLQ